jgi:UDP-N-acetylmuramate: L-alanyl-gamma-D-glutamyl-meso-diaminopimelate ligase
MHQLAIALHKKGHTVSGTDDEIFEPALSNLKAKGLLPATIGWQPQLITPDIDAVILGMHARGDNPELLQARALGLPVYSFPEYIYEESKQKTRVVVGGSHGKTTTTSMIMHVLKSAGLAFDYLVGARLEGFEQSVQVSDAPVIVCEGDEYPASVVEKRPKFHFLFPHLAIITGIAWDHINVFPTFEFYLEQFRIFIDKIEPGGTLVYNETDAVLNQLVTEKLRSDISYQPYGLPAHVIEHGQTIITIGYSSARLKVFGNHNLLNLHAAWQVCRRLGVSEAGFCDAIANFTGAARRLEILAEAGNTIVYRDFAHAPSKVKASMEAVRQQFPAKRLIAVLELHTYSSLNADFLPQYHGAMQAADAACIFYSNHALEIKKLPPISEAQIRQGFQQPDLFVTHLREVLEDWLREQDFSNTSVLLMSSGNFDGLDLTKLNNHISRTS